MNGADNQRGVAGPSFDDWIDAQYVDFDGLVVFATFVNEHGQRVLVKIDTRGALRARDERLREAAA